MTFDELIHELECDYGRINFRERLMLRRAYDVVPEIKGDKPLCDTCKYQEMWGSQKCDLCNHSFNAIEYEKKVEESADK